MIRRLLAPLLALACLIAPAAWAAVPDVTVCGTWVKVYSAGATVDIQNKSTSPVMFATSTGVPAAGTGGPVLSGSDTHRFASLATDLYAISNSNACSSVGILDGLAAAGSGSSGSGTVTQGPAGTAPWLVSAGQSGAWAFGLTGPIPAGTNTIGAVTVLGGNALPVKVTQPDVIATGTIAAATANAAYTVALANAEGVVGFTVTGLGASGATLVPEGSNDGGATWSSVNAVSPGTGALSQTLTADQQFRVNGGGHTHVRLRVSVVGTGTINVASVASSDSSLVAISAPATITPSAMTETQTIVTLASGTSKILIAANAARKSLRWMVTGTNPMTVAPGAVTVTAGNGINYNGASGTGFQGASESFEGPAVPTGAFSAVSASGTTVTVWEGQ